MKKSVTIIMCVYYVILLALAIVGFFTPAFNGMFESMGITEIEGGGAAYSKVLGMLLFVYVPTILMYFAVYAPCHKAIKAVLGILGVAGMIALTFVFFVVCSQYDDILISSSETWNDSFMFKLSIIVGDIGFVVIYALALIPPANSEKQSKIGKILGIFKSPYALPVVTILFTILLFPLAMLIVVVVVLFLVITFFSVIKYLYGAGKGEYLDSGKDAVEIYANGYTVKAQYYDYDSYNSVDRYRDEHGNFWVKKDGKFISETDFKNLKK